MHIRPMHRRMAARRPTPALSQPGCMRRVANVYFTRCSLHLRMTLQAKVRIAFDQQLPIHRPMRIVTDRATLPQRLMLEYKWPRLLAMTQRAVLVQPRHRQPSGRLENVASVRIVTLDAIHVALNDRMMLRHSKLRLRLQMALKARGRVRSRIHNKLPAPTASLDMFAPRPVARFTTRLPAELRVVHVHTCMRARGKYPSDVRVALGAGAISHVSCPRNFWRRNNRPSQSRTGYCEEHNQEQCAESRRHGRKSK